MSRPKGVRSETISEIGVEIAQEDVDEQPTKVVE